MPQRTFARSSLRAALLTLGALACLPSCGGGEAQAREPGEDSALDGPLSALEDIDTSTAEGVRAAYERLRQEYDALQGQVAQQTEELRGQALERRDEALRKLIAHCDGLERRLDELEASGGATWARMRGEAVAEAERLRSKCEELLQKGR